jgi:hypothetical protein
MSEGTKNGTAILVATVLRQGVQRRGRSWLPVLPYSGCERCRFSALLRNCGLRIGRERRIGDRPAQKIERPCQSTVVLLVRRHVGLGARFFSTFCL